MLQPAMRSNWQVCDAHPGRASCRGRQLPSPEKPRRYPSRAAPMIARTIFISLSRPSSHQARSPLPNSTPAATHLRQVYDRRTLSVLIKALVELMMLVIVHELRKGGLIQLAKNVAEFFVRIAPSGELLPVNLAQSAHESVAVLLAQLTIPVRWRACRPGCSMTAPLLLLTRLGTT